MLKKTFLEFFFALQTQLHVRNELNESQILIMLTSKNKNKLILSKNKKSKSSIQLNS